MQITIAAAFDLYVQEKEMYNLASGTIQNAHTICAWLLDEHGADVVGPDPFKAALVEFRGRGVKPSTLSFYYRTLAKFAKFCNDAGYTDPIKIPALPEPAPAVAHLTPPQVSVVLASFNLGKFNGLRNNAIIRLLFDSGIRRGELLGINEDDVLWGRNMIKIHRKGGRDGFAHMCAATKRHLWNYEKQARPRRNGAGLFISNGGKRLTPNGLRMVFKRLPQFDGVKLTPHTLRHSFAVNALLAGMDQISLSHILGHTSLDMTRRYVQLAPGERQNQHAKFTPGKKV
jgi:site-specific recombinase XerD